MAPARVTVEPPLVRVNVQLPLGGVSGEPMPWYALDGSAGADIVTSIWFGSKKSVIDGAPHDESTVVAEVNPAPVISTSVGTCWSGQ